MTDNTKTKHGFKGRFVIENYKQAWDTTKFCSNRIYENTRINGNAQIFCGPLKTVTETPVAGDNSRRSPKKTEGNSGCYNATKYYKLLDDNNRGRYSGFEWDISGKWMSVSGKLEMCGNGFHIIRAEKIRQWLECGFNLYEVEVYGDKIEGITKMCVRQVRVVGKIKNYNKRTVLENVVNPAIARTKQHTADARFYAADVAAVADAADVGMGAADVAYTACAVARTSVDRNAEKALQTKAIKKIIAGN